MFPSQVPQGFILEKNKKSATLGFNLQIATAAVDVDVVIVVLRLTLAKKKPRRVTNRGCFVFIHVSADLDYLL